MNDATTVPITMLSSTPICPMKPRKNRLMIRIAAMTSPASAMRPTLPTYLSPLFASP